ncbi:hypothetical protein PR048_023959 [Dryococelus australis]|uniref:Uncharacterized protein n=1 Tax=Dryococelus australis TaxID=614101 RepID=A0ABQ9GVN0_9NEOP|nr:hypothetical protein PR048_023959 [Dryococelus australis]
MRVKRGEYGAPSECKDMGNGRYARKHTDQRHRMARFSLAKIREWPGRGLNPKNKKEKVKNMKRKKKGKENGEENREGKYKNNRREKNRRRSSKKEEMKEERKELRDARMSGARYPRPPGNEGLGVQKGYFDIGRGLGGLRVRRWGHSTVGCHDGPAERLVSSVWTRRRLVTQADSWESRSMVCSGGDDRKNTCQGAISSIKGITGSGISLVRMCCNDDLRPSPSTATTNPLQPTPSPPFFSTAQEAAGIPTSHHQSGRPYWTGIETTIFGMGVTKNRTGVRYRLKTPVFSARFQKSARDLKVAAQSVSMAACGITSLYCEDANIARRWRRASDATRRDAPHRSIPIRTNVYGKRGVLTGASETEEVTNAPGARSGSAVSLLACHKGEPGSNPSPCSAGFLGDLPFPQPFYYGAAPFSPQSPSAPKTLLPNLFHVSLTQRGRTALAEPGHPQLIAFCIWLRQQCEKRDAHFLEHVLWTDDATLTGDGVINYRSGHQWTDEKPHALPQSRNQHQLTLYVWSGIVGNLNDLGNELPLVYEGVLLHLRRAAWFKHDVAPAHFSNTARACLNIT